MGSADGNFCRANLSNEDALNKRVTTGCAFVGNEVVGQREDCKKDLRGNGASLVEFLSGLLEQCFNTDDMVPFLPISTESAAPTEPLWSMEDLIERANSLIAKVISLPVASLTLF